MTAITSELKAWEALPALGLKTIYFQTRDDVDATDTLVITLANFGIGSVIFILANVHTTNGSVMTIEAVTSAVSAGVLTVTIPAGTDNDVRVVMVVGTSVTPTLAA